MFFSQFIKFLRYFGKGYQVKLIYMLFLSFMINLLEFLSIVLVFPFIMIMVNPGRVVNNPIAKFVEENFNIHGVNNMIIFIGSLIAGTIIIKNLYSILIQYWQSKMISKWGLEVKEKMLEYFLYAPYEADLQRGDNNIINKITSNVDDVMQYFVSKVISFISNSFVILFVFIVLMFMLPLYTLLAVLFFAIAGSIQSGFFKQWGVKLTIKKLNLTNGPYSSIINTLSCIKDIKINGCQKYFYDMYDDISEKIIPFNEKINLIPVIPQYIIEIIFIFTMTILCLGILVQYGENPSNILVSFGVVAIAIYRVVPQVYKNQVYLNYINLTKIKADELFKLYEQYSLYEYSKNKDTKEKISFKENIQIQQMSYSYDKKEKTDCIVRTFLTYTMEKGSIPS